MSHDQTHSERMRADALAITRRLREAGHEALFCGGAVRDRIMGRTPGDFDVATSARPEEGATLFPEAVLVGAKFGVLVIPRESADVEVASFRADGHYVDGRRPLEVSYSDPPTDAQRRDFTVNGLFEDPETGEVRDYVGGREDLSRRLLRAIGDPEARFREDRLRILRAVRFALQLDFAIEPATLQAVRDLAPLVEGVSAERRRDELQKILRYGRGRGLRLLEDCGLLQIVLPDVAAMRGVPQPPQWHPEGDVFVHTCLVLDWATLPSGLPQGGQEERDLLWACLLHDVGKPPTRTTDPDGRIRFNNHDRVGAEMSRTILEAFRLPRRSVDRIEALIAAHIQIASTPRMRPHRLRRFLGQPDIGLHLALHDADCRGSHGLGEILEFCQARLAEYADEPILPPPLLGGAELLKLGYPAGPEMGRILRWVRDEQLDGQLDNREAAVRRVREVFAIPDREPPVD